MGRVDSDLCCSPDRSVFSVVSALRTRDLRSGRGHPCRSLGDRTPMGSAPASSISLTDQLVAADSRPLRAQPKASVVDSPAHSSLGEPTRRIRGRLGSFSLVPRGRMDRTRARPLAAAHIRSADRSADLLTRCSDRAAESQRPADVLLSLRDPPLPRHAEIHRRMGFAQLSPSRILAFPARCAGCVRGPQLVPSRAATARPASFARQFVCRSRLNPIDTAVRPDRGPPGRGAARRLATKRGRAPAVRGTRFPQRPDPAGNGDLRRSPRRPGRLFNHYDWGGYLIWRLYPSTPVFIDGRADLYGQQLFDQFAETYQFKGAWQQTLQQWSIDTVIVPPDSPLATGLRNSPGWTVSYEDPQAVVLTALPNAIRRELAPAKSSSAKANP